MTPLAASFALALGLTAAPPADPGAGGPPSGLRGAAAVAAAPGGSKLARGGKRTTRPRADSFVPGMPAAEGPTVRRVLPPFTGGTAVAFPDTLEVVFFSNTRPVRVRVTVRLDGKPLSAAWDAHLRKLFAAFDRDGDGYLNRYECEQIFSARGVSGLLAGSHYYRSPTAAPAFEELDRDGDNRVSFPEFAAYYAEAAADLVRPRQVAVETPNAAKLTHELFALLDANKDGKLTRGEVMQAEKILLTHDKDDDECLSPLEIFPDLYADNPRRRAAMAVKPSPGMPAQAQPKGTPGDLTVYPGALPGAVTQALIKRYDKNGDYHLTRDEIGLPADEFARLDADKDGKLSAKEIEGWRTGPPDFEAALNLSRSAKDCSAVVTPRGGVMPPGVEVRADAAGRAVLRVGKQFLDLSVTPPPGAAQRNRDAQQLMSSFPQGKNVVTEDEIAGPQFQFLRIVYDAADFDGDGKLTRAEFQKYLDLQQSTIDLALSLTYATRTPSLFQLMDENGDGRLGIRELRTAFDRLIVLEPSGGDVVTTAAIQPSAAVRLGQSAFVAQDPASNGNPFVRDGPKPTRGPLWFVKMDRNGDGDVSRSEFLGPPEDFAAIDANGDGLISTEEAIAYDKKARQAEAKAKK